MPQRPTINIKIYNVCKRSLHSNILLFWSYRLSVTHTAVFHYNYCSLIHGAIKDTNHWQLSRQSLSTKFTQLWKLRTCGKQHCRKYSSSLYSRELLPSHTLSHTFIPISPRLPQKVNITGVFYLYFMTTTMSFTLAFCHPSFCYWTITALTKQPWTEVREHLCLAERTHLVPQMWPDGNGSTRASDDEWLTAHAEVTRGHGKKRKWQGFNSGIFTV